MKLNYFWNLIPKTIQLKYGAQKCAKIVQTAQHLNIYLLKVL